jgi:hypothetical protein
MTSFRIGSVSVFAVAALFLAATSAQAEVLRYPVKYICNTFNSEDLSGAVAIQGAYRTAINVNNPNGAAVTFARSFNRSVLTAGGGPPVSDTQTLPAGEATVIDCTIIASVLFGTNVGQFPVFPYEGYVTITAAKPLDITAIYTAGPSDGSVATIHVNVIQGRRVELKLSAAGAPSR